MNFSFIKARKYLILVWFIILIILAFLIGKLIDKEPYISGSGIPQVKGIMGGYIKNRPFSIILNKKSMIKASKAINKLPTIVIAVPFVLYPDYH